MELFIIVTLAMSGMMYLYIKRAKTNLKTLKQELQNCMITRDRVIECDRTNECKLEIELKESRALLSLISEGIIIIDIAGRIIFVNDRAAKLTGYTNYEMEGRGVHELLNYATMDGISIEAEESAILEVFRTEKDLECAKGVFWHKGGQSFPVEYRTYLRRDEAGVISGLTLIFNDISDIKEYENKIREYSEIIKYSNDAVIMTTPEVDYPGPQIVYVNDALLKSTGYEESEVLGKTPRMFQGIRTDRNELKKIREALIKGESYRSELVNYTKMGEEYWISIGVFPIPDIEGNIKNFVAIERDITDIKKKEIQLKEYSERLEEQQIVLLKAITEAKKANLAKTQFLTNMSNQLKNPLDHISNKMGNLQDASPEYRELASEVKESINRLTKIVTDVLDLSKIEAGEVVFDHNPLDLSNLVHLACIMHEAQIEAKGLELIKNFESNNIPIVLGDQYRLMSIINNILSNAVEYTERGKIEIDIRKRNIDEGKVEIDIEISDSGIGISQENIDLLFQKKYGETGLNLTIAKQLIELMGGSLIVKSEVNVGSSFRIIIPFEMMRQDQYISLNANDNQELIFNENAKILIAEDHVFNQNLIEKMMRKLEISNYEIVDNGKKAIDLVLNNYYDVVILDCHLPEVSGYKVVEEIRKENSRRGQRTLVLAMTALMATQDFDRAREIGIDDFVNKPMNLDQLKIKLSKKLAFVSENSKILKN